MRDSSYRVFISHAGADLGIARLMERGVKGAGATCIIDAYDLHAGGEICAWISGTIARCDELLVLVSPRALESVFVGYELGWAEANNLWIAPILYDLDFDELRRSRLGGVLARRSALPLDGFSTYETQLSERVATVRSRKLEQVQARLPQPPRQVIRSHSRGQNDNSAPYADDRIFPPEVLELIKGKTA